MWTLVSDEVLVALILSECNPHEVFLSDIVP
jgi:hypothetical protein